ncbi:ELONGATOR COMPLEX PROTEIN 5 [Salix viminalis]|uniref:Elongator complex protein 5 n=1 Tax=Salix viminalis TaxID=40686 RepID=A0A9Q0QJ31_SALVM|nr:ELONGATOR COMPLEX PROTEIN 5 [Salix viminalis]
MAESMCRTLRDGSLEGEQAPALTIKDITTSPFGFHVFSHVLSQLSSFILASKSQSRGIVIVAFSRSPSFYVDLLKRRGIDVNSSHKWIQILDCYSDPLGWKYQLMGSGNCMDVSHETSSNLSRVCKDVKDLDKLYSMILELGKGLVGQGKDRFSVAIDSINEMLRHASTPTVAGLLSNLRSHEQISSIFWLLHSDLHEVKVTSALEYLSSVVASVEPLHQTAGGKRGDLENLSLLEQNFGKGKLQIRFKRRNGRVRVVNEGFHIDQSSSNFTSVLSEDGLVNQINQSLLPKVQFDLELSEKERIDRAKVVLPFEHQGNGEPIHIYDGRRSLTESKTEATLSSSGNSQKTDSGEGEIIYFRDSDDEMPDSDEDPDDDLDI